jgi:integrase/recombinase XerC
VAARQTPKSATTNGRDAPDEAVRAAVERYVADLAGAPLAARTREAYESHVRGYGAWLWARESAAAALELPRARDHAARDFKRFLKVERGWQPSSVNLALAGVDSFNRFLGLGAANVAREPVAQASPRALSEEEQRDLLRAAEASKPRDRAIVVVLLYTGLRLGELAALDLADTRLSARKGIVVVRAGKGDSYREVPLNGAVRAALECWLEVRRRREVGGQAAGEPALFMAARGGRLSPRAIDRVVRGAGARAGIALSAHVLRHTWVTNLVRGGHDVVLVAELAGHRRLETTRRYSLPSHADRQAAMESLELEP